MVFAIDVGGINVLAFFSLFEQAKRGRTRRRDDRFAVQVCDAANAGVCLDGHAHVVAKDVG